jgi:hypothetical protein
MNVSHGFTAFQETNSGTVPCGTGTPLLNFLPFVYVFLCSGATVPEAAERGDAHGERGGERGRGAHRVRATGKKDDQIGIDNL